MSMTHAFGLDIGGTGTKGAVVDLSTGELVSERIRLETPRPATVDAVVHTAEAVVEASGWQGPIGCAFPGIVKHGVTHTAANLQADWEGVPLAERLSRHFGQPATVLNDADAAGIAEMRLGAGRGVQGVVLMLTLGTGIGSAFFIDGALLPNAELGMMELDGRIAERHASAAARKRDGLSYDEWVPRLQRYLSHVERLFSPDLIIVGGGVSRKAERFLPQLRTQAELVPAGLRQNAGIVGAALAGAEL